MRLFQCESPIFKLSFMNRSLPPNTELGLTTLVVKSPWMYNKSNFVPFSTASREVSARSNYETAKLLRYLSMRIKKSFSLSCSSRCVIWSFQCVSRDVGFDGEAGEQSWVPLPNSLSPRLTRKPTGAGGRSYNVKQRAEWAVMRLATTVCKNKRLVRGCR